MFTKVVLFLRLTSSTREEDDIRSVIQQLHTLENQMAENRKVRSAIFSLLDIKGTITYETHFNSHIRLNSIACKKTLTNLEHLYSNMQSELQSIYSKYPLTLINNFKYVLVECCQIENISINCLEERLDCDKNEIIEYLRTGFILPERFLEVARYLNIPLREVYLNRLGLD